MRPNIAEKVPSEAWELLGKIRQIIHALPELIEKPAFICGIQVSKDLAVGHYIPNCHVVTRALASFFPVEVHDGFVCVYDTDGKKHMLEHSWLTLIGSDGTVILDPWPLGVVSGPALFIQDYAFHFGPESSFLDHRKDKFLCEVEITTAAIRAVLHTLWPNTVEDT